MGLNSRSSGGGNPDGLALDLQFAADKTLTARKGPTPSFARASTATFIGPNGLIQSAAINTPRFDHDPMTGECLGLLIEESRSNLLLRSEEFGTTWSPTNTTVSPNQTVSPDGQTTADKLVEDLALGVHQLAQAFIPVSGTTYTASVFVKAAGRGFAFVGFVGSSFFSTFVSINLSTGAVTTALGTPIASSSTSMGNGWWRVSITLASTGTLSSNFDIRTSIDGNWANRSYLGDGTSGIFLWGAQLEAGAFPTSYIPTAATVPVVRSADVCSITGGAFEAVWNPVEATVYAESSRLSLAGTLNHSIFSVSGSGETRFGLYHRSATTMRLTAAYEGLQLTAPSNFNLAGVQYKAAAGLSASSSGFFFDTTEIPNTFASAPGSADTLSLSVSTATSVTNGHLASLRIYRKRLSNAKLQAITAP